MIPVLIYLFKNKYDKSNDLEENAQQDKKQEIYQNNNIQLINPNKIEIENFKKDLNIELNKLNNENVNIDPEEEQKNEIEELTKNEKYFKFYDFLEISKKNYSYIKEIAEIIKEENKKVTKYFYENYGNDLTINEIKTLESYKILNNENNINIKNKVLKFLEIILTNKFFNQLNEIKKYNAIGSIYLFSIPVYFLEKNTILNFAKEFDDKDFIENYKISPPGASIRFNRKKKKPYNKKTLSSFENKYLDLNYICQNTEYFEFLYNQFLDIYFKEQILNFNLMDKKLYNNFKTFFHFSDQEDYFPLTTESNYYRINHFFNNIFIPTYNNLIEAYFISYFKKKDNLFFLHFTNEHCYPWQKRHLEDYLQSIKGIILNFKSFFNEDIRIENIITSIYNFYKNNNLLNETEIYEKIETEFIKNFSEIHSKHGAKDSLIFNKVYYPYVFKNQQFENMDFFKNLYNDIIKFKNTHYDDKKQEAIDDKIFNKIIDENIDEDLVKKQIETHYNNIDKNIDNKVKISRIKQLFILDVKNYYSNKQLEKINKLIENFFNK